MSERHLVLTPAGLKRIDAELLELQTVRRQEVAEHIRQAKDLGDVSENTEYEDAKQEQAFLEGRIADLKLILGSSIILEEADIPIDEVGVGSVVKVRDLELKEDWEFTMVGSFEADPVEDRISNQSPIGEALMGSGWTRATGPDVDTGECR